MADVCNPGGQKAEAEGALERLLKPGQATQGGTCSSGV